MKKSKTKESPFYATADGLLYHFVIMRSDERAIWRRPFVTYEEAKAEMAEKKLSGNWSIVKRINQFQPASVERISLEDEEIKLEKDFANW